MNLSTRLLNILLLTSAVLLSTTIVLGAYFVLQHNEIEKLKSTLLSKAELQGELLKAQPHYYSAFPHMVKDIGYVLNPDMDRSSLWAAEGDTYQINSLGLRGEEIPPKLNGVTRILIVGDSLVFGWKLVEKDKLSSVLNHRISEQLGLEGKIEFITIALPGWNVKSEQAFLETHLRLLNPDLILWWTIPNDIEDVAGVVPPGIVTNWASPHDESQSPFVGLSMLHKRNGPFMPIIADRFNENWKLITSFKSTYGIPTMVIDPPPYMDLNPATGLDVQHLLIPKQYRNNERWRLSTSDAHPTRWANQVLSVGILNSLVQSRIIPEINFSPEELGIIGNFEQIDPDDHHQDYVNNNFRGLPDKIPTRYERNDPSLRESILFGLSPSGTMARSGTLFLRDTNNSPHIMISIDSGPNSTRFPGTAIFTVRNQEYEETQKRLTIDADHVVIKLDVPASEKSSIYEISWKYDFLRCSGPSSCTVGVMEYAKFEH